MKGFDKIIESLEVAFVKARHIKMLQPLSTKTFYDIENTLLIVNRGQLTYSQGETQQKIAAGDMLFIPGGKATILTYGPVDLASVSKEHLTNLQSLQFPVFEAAFDNYSYITFDARVFNAVNLFATLDVPPFSIENNLRLRDTLKDIFVENSTDQAGSNRMVKANTERLTIELVRHLFVNNLFAEKLATNSDRLQNPRFISLLNYIKDNLKGNLSNRILASVAHVSEDYVSQYFKLLTGVNAQDYIEYQRMEQAVRLLKTSQKNVQDIGKEVGFKDTAYFCRRFKMMFGISAGQMRKQEADAYN